MSLDGKGYDLLGSDGSVFAYGDATSYGSPTLHGEVAASMTIPD